MSLVFCLSNLEVWTKGYRGRISSEQYEVHVMRKYLNLMDELRDKDNIKIKVLDNESMDE